MEMKGQMLEDKLNKVKKKKLGARAFPKKVPNYKISKRLYPRYNGLKEGKRKNLEPGTARTYKAA
jgi:hypothetical protein